MSNEVVFIKPLARPHYPMERGKAHAGRVAHAGLKQEGIFIALSPVIKHTLTHTNTHAQAGTQHGSPHSELPVTLALLLKKGFLEYF